MGSPPDYKVLSRRAPFKGITSNNPAVDDADGASEALNIDFGPPGSKDKQATVSARNGFRFIQGFSEKYSCFTPYTEPLTITKSPESAQNSYGAVLFGETTRVYAPVSVTYLNPLGYKVCIKRIAAAPYISLTVKGVSVSLSSASTLSDLSDALAPYSITPATSTFGNQRYYGTVPYSSSYTSGLVLSSVIDTTTSDLVFTVPCRSVMPLISISALAAPTSATTLIRKQIIHCMSIGAVPNSVPQFTDGYVLAEANLAPGAELNTSFVANGGAGANYYGGAVQCEYVLTSTSVPDSIYNMLGPISPTCVSDASAGTSFTWRDTSDSGPNLAYLNSKISRLYDVDSTLHTISIGGANQPIRWGRPAFVGTDGVVTNVIWGSGSTTTGGRFADSAAVPISVSVRFKYYRTKAQTTAALAASAPLYFVSYGVPDVSTSRSPFSSSVVDSSLTEVLLPAAETLSSSPIANNISCVEVFQDRVIYGTTKGQLRWTPPGQYLCFTDTGYQIFESPILALRAVNDVLYVFTADGIFTLTGTIGSLDSSVQKISVTTVSTGAGSQACSACTFIDGTVLFVGGDNRVYVLSGQQGPIQIPEVELPTNSPLTLSSDGTSTYPSLSRTKMAFSSKHRKAFIGSIGSTRLDVIDDQMRWSVYTLPHALIDLDSFSGQLVCLLASGSGCAIWELSDDFLTDAGTAFTWRYASQWESLGDPRTEKLFAKIQVDLAEGVSQNTTLTVSTEYDYLPGKTGTTIAFPLRVNQGWGNNAWGRTPWGDKNQVNVVVPLSNEKHRSMRVIFEGTQNLAISGWSIEVIGAGAHAKNGVASSSPSGT